MHNIVFIIMIIFEYAQLNMNKQYQNRRHSNQL